MNITPSYGPDRTNRTHTAALILAAMLILMLITQLFSYEDFYSALMLVLPFNDQPLIVLSAAAIVLAELFALPYLLQMFLSPLMRIVSALCFILVTLFWLLTILTNAHAENVPLFGDILVMHGGVLPLLWILVFALLGASVVTADTRVQ